jgi:serine/threonine protein kinase
METMKPSTLVKREDLFARKGTNFFRMMNFASRGSTSTADSDDFLCDVGDVAAITLCGGDTECKTSSPTSSMSQKPRAIMKKNSFNKLTHNFSTKSKLTKLQGHSDPPNEGGYAATSTSTISSSPTPSGSSLHSTLALEVGKSAHEYLEECLVTEVSVLDRDKFDAVPEYQKDQLIIAEHLGKGSYSDVFEVRLNVSIFDQSSDSIDDIIKRLEGLSSAAGASAATGEPSPPVHQKNQDAANVTATAARDDITAGRRRPPRPHRRVSFTNSIREAVVKRPNRCDERQVVYAMKCLRPQIRSDADQFIIGAEDLVHETALLATLNHPNIISLHGRAAGQLQDAFTLNDGYFILLDRLKKETLKDCIGEWWRYPEFYLQGPTVRQLDIALAIADAIAYLHSKNIVYRDLKPANVGFDNQGVVKLFDFGFAVGLPAKNDLDVSNPGGLLFDKCGTPRYMAPEVGLELGYRTEADVYSFGILLWEMCSLTKPFAEFKCPVDFERAVFVQGARPSAEKHWPALLIATMKKCWSTRPGKRPSIASVEESLRTVKTSISGGEGPLERKRLSYSRTTRRLSINMGHDYILG